jgi:hypothetical protein
MTKIAINVKIETKKIKIEDKISTQILLNNLLIYCLPKFIKHLI